MHPFVIVLESSNFICEVFQLDKLGNDINDEQ